MKKIFSIILFIFLTISSPSFAKVKEKTRDHLISLVFEDKKIQRKLKQGDYRGISIHDILSYLRNTPDQIVYKIRFKDKNMNYKCLEFYLNKAKIVEKTKKCR